MGNAFTQDARERFEHTWTRLMEGREKKPATMKDVDAIETLFKQHPTYRRAAIDMTRGAVEESEPRSTQGPV